MKKFITPLLLIGITILLLFLAQDLSAIPAQQPSRPLTLLPELIPPPGIYARSITLRLKPSHPQGVIVFTLDGSLPSPEHGSIYVHPIYLDSSLPHIATIRAVEIVGDVVSPVITASYSVGLSEAVPIVTLAASPVDLWHADQGILANNKRRGSKWERPVEFSILHQEENTGPAQSAGFRITGDPLLVHDKHTFRVYFRSEYNNPRLDINPFLDDDSKNNSYKRLLLQAARDRNGLHLLRDQLASEVLLSIGLPAARGRMVHLYINGTSWGLYRLTERVDDVYTNDLLNTDITDIVQEGNAREGSNTSWKELMAWLENHDLSNDVNLEALDTRFSVSNFLNEACIQHFFGLPADAFYAVRAMDGSWFWVYEGGGTVPIINSDFHQIFQRIMLNQNAKARFVVQCSDLLNTALSEQKINVVLAPHIQALSTSFIAEYNRWRKTPPWQTYLDDQLSSLAENRTRMWSELNTTMDNPGHAELQILVSPQQTGKIYINGKTRLHPALPGDDYHYLQNTDLVLNAVSQQGYTFEEWQCEPSCAFTDPQSQSVTHTMKINQKLTAVFRETVPNSELIHPDDVHFNEFWINDNGTRYASVGYRALYGDWIELRVEKRGGVDLRGWRVTVNNTKDSVGEGSIYLPDIDALASIPRGTVLLLLTTVDEAVSEQFPVDDLNAIDRQMIFYAGNGNLDIWTESGFDLKTGDDNIALIAPGRLSSYSEDRVIDFIAEGLATDSFSFGALEDGVTFDQSFSYLGND
ncbi:MAG: CotH kinase family protein, partial [Anaerolineae bacterium]|nr:CotH kinase family protein [Anaerolineae bacterium]